MRQALFLALAVGCGCQNLEGPIEVRNKDRADLRDGDGRPVFSIEEQERRGRERLSVPFDDRAIGPPLAGSDGIGGPSPTGR